MLAMIRHRSDYLKPMNQQLRRAAATLVASAVFFGLWSAPARSQDLIGLYLTWSHDPTTTMTINWVDIYEDSSSTVWFREAETDQWKEAKADRSNVGPTTMQLRRVELVDLKPDTFYEFGIGNRRKDASTFWRFRTMPEKLTRPIRFVSGGDMMHTRSMVDTMNEQMQKLNPDFAFLVGDLAYANGVVGSRWIDWLQSWKIHSVAEDKRLIPMVLGIGNHEVIGHYNGKVPDDAPYFYSLFALPEGRSYYALDFGKYLSLIVLDSQHTEPIEGAQAEWLQQSLAERSGQEFLFAGYHYPAYGTSKGPKRGLPIDSPTSLAIQNFWLPHLERYGASAVFENDHHNYKRSHRIRNRQRDDENGLLFLGDGSWGVTPREVPDPDVAWWLAKAEARNHLWCVEILPGGTAQIEAIDAKGKVFDEVELVRPRTTPEP